MDSLSDIAMMARALQQAERARYFARPNPHVGCVLTRDGQVIGEGHTQPAGGNHAEIQALASAGDASGATAYVTLEPCSHQGKTGPCADALIQAGVQRVVAAMTDPNPAVSGAGLDRLRAAGIEVQCGVLEAEARALIPGFILRMERGWGRVRAKMAMSLDGRTAMASGESQWITGPAARADVQRLRAMSCAIVTGVGTVMGDDCSLTVRDPNIEEAQRAVSAPLRVVLDSGLQTPVDAHILDSAAPTLLCHATGASIPAPLEGLDLLGLPEEQDGGLSLTALMSELSQRQCNEILLESGPRLAGALLRAGLLDELIIYAAPCLMGSLAKPLFELPFNQMADKLALQIDDIRKVGEDWRITARPLPKGAN